MELTFGSEKRKCFLPREIWKKNTTLTYLRVIAETRRILRIVREG